MKKKIKDWALKTPIIYVESKGMSIKNMEKTSQNNRTAIDKTRNICYNTDMKNTENKITYREWLIARNEGLTRADKKEAARAYMVKERAALVAREKAKNWNPSA